MSIPSPLTRDEIVFAARLLFETLYFNEPIEKTAEPKFRELGLNNGAIENFSRVMEICHYGNMLAISNGITPPSVDRCPWEGQAIFLARDVEIQDWIRQRGRDAADIRCFIRSESAQ